MKYKIVDDPKNLCVKCPKSLKEKIFIPKNSNCQFFFTIGQLGESLWNKTLDRLKISDFMFFDPNNRESPVEYNSLFDPNLKRYFNRGNVKQHLRKNHLITDKNEIICNVGEYNDYRRFIHRLKTEGNCHKLKHKNREEMMQYQIKIYNENLKKRLEKTQKFQELYKKHESCSDSMSKYVTRNLKNKRRQMEEEKRSKFINDIKSYHDHLKRIEQLKVIKENEMKERGFYRNLELVKKQIFVLEKRRERRAKIKKKIFERDEALKRRLCIDESIEPVNYIIRCPLKI